MEFLLSHLQGQLARGVVNAVVEVQGAAVLGCLFLEAVCVCAEIWFLPAFPCHTLKLFCPEHLC